MDLINVLINVIKMIFCKTSSCVISTDRINSLFRNFVLDAKWRVFAQESIWPNTSQKHFAEIFEVNSLSSQ